MSSSERIRDAANVLREAYERTVALPEPSDLDMKALREADFGAIFVSPDLALALADWLGFIATANERDHHVAFEDQALKVAETILGPRAWSAATATTPLSRTKRHL